MRNLCVFDTTVKELETNDRSSFSVACYGHNETSSAGALYICTDNLKLTYYGVNGVIWAKDLTDSVSSGNSPINITYLTLNDALSIGLSNGEILSVSQDGNSCDITGACDPGLLAMEWSPDQELLVLVTKELNVILMSYTYDVINEAFLLKEEFGEKQFVNVGWGKKETQFHGSEGKQARVVKDVVADDDAKIIDNSCKITWRGDCQLFAVGFNVEGIRRFKVFDRDGNIQYTSEKHLGVESNLSWRPSGNVIATTQRQNDKYVVAFFEKNGLRHIDFPIPVTATTVVEDLTWSSDSEVLALQCFDKAVGEHKVLIFTSSNYHWYLKQTLNYKGNKIIKILWDNDFDVSNNKRLHVILNDGLYLSYNFVWCVDHSKGMSDNDSSIVAVIDGNKLLLTGFRETVVPPPMSASEINTDTPINSVYFFNDKMTDSNNFFVFTSDCKLVFYKFSAKHPLVYEKTRSIQLPEFLFPNKYYNWHWHNCKTIFCTEVTDNIYYIIEYTMENDELKLKAKTLLSTAIAKLHSHPNDDNTTFILLINGEILEYKSGGEILPIDVTFPSTCIKFDVIAIDNELSYVGYSHRGNFYINDLLVLNNVNSYTIHSHFLLITTLSHMILCTELTKAGIEAIKEYKRAESSQVYSRKIERGAKLVIAVPNDTRTVLQMPRGNLEVIQPRPLSLKIIGEYLNSMKYHEAFDLMRKQRINLNLIYDHDPDKFMNNVDVFLESIKNNNWLNLFLSDLDNIDVTNTMYSSSYVSRNRTSSTENKVSKVCDTVREYLYKRPDSDARILPILTSYVKKNTAEDLENALQIVKDIKKKEENSIKLAVSSDEALKFLLYMVKVEDLFDVALGMYDFDLVLLVANKSQKDPKEYIQLLNDFNQMEENFKKFSINKHLKRFSKAVECLSKCGQAKHDELRSFVKYHSLYGEALKLFDSSDKIYKDISEDFGSYLILKKQYTEAGIVFRKGGNYKQAMECFINALQWEMVIELAYKIEGTNIKELCWELVSKLKEEKRHTESLLILEQYCGDVEETIKYAAENALYKSALRLCSQHGKEDLKEKIILPNVLEEYRLLSDLIENNWTTFIKHKDRLKVVRENKSKVSEDMYDPSYENRDSDLYSDAGSTVASSSSRSSSRTFRSSKNRRKHERKLVSLKEGSRYEDIGLLTALHNLVTSSFEMRSHVKEVNMALRCLGEDVKGSQLQKSLSKLLKDMKDSEKDIWTNELVLEATKASIDAQAFTEDHHTLPQGIATLEPHMRIAPVIQDVKWKIEFLE